MADKKISDLIEATNASDTDIFIVEDNANTKKITKANLSDTLLGNRTYTEQNVVTNGESLTNSINELDVDLASHKEEDVHQIGGVHGLDIESGTWTPTLSSSDTPPTYNYVDRIGTFHRVGKLVFIYCHIRGQTTNLGTGNVVVSGLPFTPKNNLVPVLMSISNIFNQVVNGYISGSSVNFIYGNTIVPTSELAGAAGRYLSFTAIYTIN